MVYGRSALKIEKGGDVSAAIENLVEAGFLAERSDRAARGSIHVNKRVFIGKTIDEVDTKVRAIRRPVGVSVRAALVYDGHLSPLAASDGYFDAIVPFDSLLRDRP